VTEGGTDGHPRFVDATVAIGLVLTAGLVLRLLGVSHGFPDFVTGDERDAEGWNPSGVNHVGHSAGGVVVAKEAANRHRQAEGRRGERHPADAPVAARRHQPANQRASETQDDGKQCGHVRDC